MNNIISSVLIFILLAISCSENNYTDLGFEPNTSLRNVDEEFKTIAEEYDESVIYSQYNEVEMRREYLALGKKDSQWHKTLYYLKFTRRGMRLRKVGYKSLEEDTGLILWHRLSHYHLFDIPSEDVLLEEHEKLCGKPRDPSHYLTYEVVMISGSSVRQIYYGNPHGRFEMCPAIKNWDHAAKISEIFNSEWIETGHSGNFGPAAATTY